MAVNLIDPNEINNENVINGAPQYQDMHIFAKLTATAKDRTVITINGNSAKVKTESGSDFETNFLGGNKNLDFTTNWYDGSTPNTQEAFGITSIKTVINSSFIPQVNIKFADIRGLSFFNNAESPYRILFDFPPPTFELTIKGFYGKALTYKLHLVKYTSEFQSETGNFVIDADFVAMTYAPLSDVLLQYSAHTAFIGKGETLSTNVGVRPTNTLDLIEKIKNLYSVLPNKIKNDVNSGVLTKSITGIENNSEAFTFLSSFKEDEYLRVGSPEIYTLTTDAAKTDNEQLVLIPSFNSYRSKYKDYNYVTKNSPKPALLIGFETGVLAGTTTITPTQVFTTVTDSTTNMLINALKNYTTEVIKRFDLLFSGDALSFTGTIKSPKIINNMSRNGNRIVEYVCIDITDMYNLLRSQSAKSTNSKNKASDDLTTNINKMVYDILGMNPTIYNIFEILLDDVDTFFDALRYTANKAQNEHTIDKGLFVADKAYTNGEQQNTDVIYSFPLIIENNKRESPIDLRERMGIKFPELDFIDDYIATYLKYKKELKKLHSKDNANTNGDNVWIPFTPADSVFATSHSTGSMTPYDNPRDAGYTYGKLIERYNVLTNTVRNAVLNNELYTQMYSNSEAINLANSIQDSVVVDMMITQSDKYASDISSFLTYAKNELSSLYNFEDASANLNGVDFYTSRENDNYVGFEINNKLDITPKSDVTDESDPLNAAIKKMRPPVWAFIDTDYYGKKYFYSKENVLVIKDTNNTPDMPFTATKFLCGHGDATSHTIDQLFNSGNILYDSLVDKVTAFELKNAGDFIDIWSTFLGAHAKTLFDTYGMTTLNDPEMLSLFYLSSFGNTCSMFNKAPNYLNESTFSFASIVEMPEFMPAYIGAILRVSSSSFKVDAMKELFSNIANVHLFADMHDCNKYLSKNDKAAFIAQYNDFMASRFPQLRLAMANMYTVALNRDVLNRTKYYEEAITSAGIDKLMMNRIYLINYNEITFKMTPDNDKYTSLATIVTSPASNKAVGDFFTTFFKKLGSELRFRKKAIVDDDNAFKSMSQDKDVINQMYYSFKNINDKWISGTSPTIIGYPFNLSGNRLIDMFAFVDRSMNPIGDTMINPEMLVNLFESDETSIFTVLSTLLSVNGFEFFPIQNFMTVKGSENWKDCFRINTGTIINTSPMYVCMYVGGSSNYLSNSNNNYFNDGIENLDKESQVFNDKAFIFESAGENLNQMNNKNVDWSNVNAFKIKFGAQNQSMFKDIKIDSKEFPETNESLQILSRLAGDNSKQAPTPKGQNLFNLYENRAYKATVTGLGNAMIQPTQYFQLENVPMYNGVYLILGVEHNISENHMTTSFNGTKILKYPIPRVIESSVAFGYGGSSSHVSNNDDNTVAEIKTPIGDMGRVKSMYEHKIGGAFVKLTSKGEDFIKSVCASYHHNELFSKTAYYNGIQRTWVATPSYTHRTMDANGNVLSETPNVVMTNSNYAEAIISMINYYSAKYNLNANIIAAEEYKESGYRTANYSYNKDRTVAAMGMSQFITETAIRAILKSSEFTSTEKNSLLKGMSTNDTAMLLSPFKSNSEIKYERNIMKSDTNLPIFMQNVFDNPEIMIKAHCSLIESIERQCNGLASSSIFCYYHGSHYAKNYAATIERARMNGISEADISTGVKYVYGIFDTLNKSFYAANILKMDELALDDHSTHLA